MNGIFYHATNVEFDQFDTEMAFTNGHLGVWTT